MRSIISAALTAVLLLAVLTGCGSKNNNTGAANNQTTVATPAPTATNAPENNGTAGAAGDAANRVENGVDDTVNGVENGVNDVIDGVENGVNDMLGEDGVVNGDMGDGRVEEDAAKATSTPQAR